MKKIFKILIDWATRPFFWLYRRWHYRPVKIDEIRITTDPADCDLIVIGRLKGRDHVVVRLPNPDPNHFYPDETVSAGAVRDAAVSPALDDFSAL